MNENIGFFLYGAFRDSRLFLTALIHFWTEIETKGGEVGGGTSFYERFSIR